MKIIELDQNTPEWLKFRFSRIGASDAPIIMGQSPYKTANALYHEKVGEVSSVQSKAMMYGHEQEPLVRTLFNESARQLYKNGDICVEPMVVQSDLYDWAIASLDGIDLANNILIEIKCASYKDHQTAKDGSIPEKYYAQLQHQMFVTGFSKIIYVSFHDGDLAMLPCVRNKDFISQMVSEELEFMECLKSRTPPALIERDYEERTDSEFTNTAHLYIECEKDLLLIQQERDELRDKLVKLSGEKNCRGNGIKISHHTRKGSIDYSKIPEISGVDLEKYRKKSSTYCSISST